MPRLLTILISLFLITVTVRLGDAAMQLMHGLQPELTPSQAMAAEPEKAEAVKADDKSSDGQAAATKEADHKEGSDKTVVKDTTGDAELAEGGKDPFAPQFSDEELTVLQSLSKRREALSVRERDLDQREKLLQVAEKKVEQKVAELSVLKKQLEELLNRQQQAESDNIKQLVKIYENMKPADAAKIFNDLQGDVLLDIISTMSEKKSAPVLAAMDPMRARDISARLAALKALPPAPAAAPR